MNRNHSCPLISPCRKKQAIPLSILPVPLAMTCCLCYVAHLTHRHRIFYSLPIRPICGASLTNILLALPLKSIYSNGIRLQNTHILLRFTDGYLYLDNALQPLSELNPLPLAVQATLSTEPEWAGCYDITNDEKTIYYIQDKRSLCRYDIPS